MALLGTILGLADTVIERVIPDQNKRDELRNALRATVLEHEAALVRAQAEVVTTEAKSQSWITRSWRPITMLSFLSVIMWRWFVAPLIAGFSTLFGAGIPLEILVPAADPQIEQAFFTLVTVGLGGYVMGRSGEKIAEAVFSQRQDDTVINTVTGDRS